MLGDRKIEASGRSNENSNKESGAPTEGGRGNTKLTNVDTPKILGRLNGLFDDVMSGREYDVQQVKNATNLTNTIIKVLRFEFDVYKHFAEYGRTPDIAEPDELPNRYRPRNDYTGIPRHKSNLD
jgi:hypothetical protein